MCAFVGEGPSGIYYRSGDGSHDEWKKDMSGEPRPRSKSTKRRRSRCGIEAGHVGPLSLALVVLLLLSCAAGCGTEHFEAFDSGNKAERREVFHFAGNILVDGEKPSNAGTVFVVANDLARPDEPVGNRSVARATSDGQFTFTTYSAGDGLPKGRYVLTFVQLTKQNGKSLFLGPDRLNNLFIDPDRNARSTQFVVDHKSPGVTDLILDLKVKGRKPIDKAPARALTRYPFDEG
jgi:hypothetical protein